MQLLQLSLPSAAENLALDEALLEAAEQCDDSEEVLRIWEPGELVVVLGRSSRVADEVNEPACRQRGVPVLRRASGGAAIVAGPGCLMYAVVLDLNRRPHLRSIDEAHRYVLGRMADAISGRLALVSHQGTSDLTLDTRKFSGNSLRVKRNRLLYHGTLLYDFPLATIEKLLKTPPRQPNYRQSRSHDDFLINLPLSREQLCQGIIESWRATTAVRHWPVDLTARLTAEKYTQDHWNLRH